MSVGRAERISYLREHPELLKLTKQAVILHLKDAGLLSRKTSWIDVNLSNLMLAAHGRRAAQKFSAMKHVRDAVK